MNRATRRVVVFFSSLGLNAALFFGLGMGLSGCETTTQRCMSERETCVQACEGKDKKSDCEKACDEALDKCMTQ